MVRVFIWILNLTYLFSDVEQKPEDLETPKVPSSAVVRESDIHVVGNKARLSKKGYFFVKFKSIASMVRWTKEESQNYRKNSICGFFFKEPVWEQHFYTMCAKRYNTPTSRHCRNSSTCCIDGKSNRTRFIGWRRLLRFWWWRHKRRWTRIRNRWIKLLIMVLVCPFSLILIFYLK